MTRIETKRLGATTHLGSRVKAWTEDGRSVTLPWDYSLNAPQMHDRAAATLAGRVDCVGRTKRGYRYVTKDGE